MGVKFTHPYLTHPLSEGEQIELAAELALHRAEHGELRHLYDGRQSSGGDPRLTKQGKLGNKYVGEDA